MHVLKNVQYAFKIQIYLRWRIYARLKDQLHSIQKKKPENRLSYPFIGVPSMAGICMIGMYVSENFMPKANYPKRKRNAVAVWCRSGAELCEETQIRKRNFGLANQDSSADSSA